MDQLDHALCDDSELQCIFNGANIDPITPSRGLRQGDPLSPHLFLFCVKGLYHALTEAANTRQIHGCKISASSPPITHLLFADDSLLFFKKDVGETQLAKQVLNSYEAMSGQAMYY